ncbi:hypothetical protein ACVIHI_008635 [Bradyrhizobium sp. USDA 4524]|uniref:hypothetical protein n=1 Tax=unclassified Bradyrhizobium TaxID=2631580 RepID=UPI0020A051DA|nr:MULTISPECIES: hypothetical protein [unclassified Bradyrhizobium]MCP1845901.1 hypothetical protein [Bradyrhizobium sp. USDA 4538]MCP1907465.1 hypothetical protein [Bradyrhizobium sp. USDA 4537]MCP1985251.1 hypothetical protein [Bradyrhizobium sp. USDA 4539]
MVEAAKSSIDTLQKLSAANLPVVPLGKFFSPIAFKKSLKGFLNTPMPVFWNVEK